MSTEALRIKFNFDFIVMTEGFDDLSREEQYEKSLQFALDRLKERKVQDLNGLVSFERLTTKAEPLVAYTEV